MTRAFPKTFVPSRHPRQLQRRSVRYLLMISVALGIFSPFEASEAATLPRKPAFYVVKPASSAPTLEGTLSDECWKNADVASAYYEYWKANPGPGKLPTEFRMLYSDRGIHLKVTNYDNEARRARGAITRGDDPELWKDDCAQVYFDPAAKGIGFANFTVNILGTRGDMKRLDAAVTIPEWSGDEWVARTTVLDDRWVIEAFFPWSDLGSTAHAGEVWMFDHVRFAWRDEQLTAVTWAPGGNYANPRFFGYVYFAGPDKVAYERVAEALHGIATPPWMIPMGEQGEQVLVAKDEKKPDLVSIPEFIETYRSEMKDRKNRLQKSGSQLLSPELENRCETLDKLSPLEAFNRINEIVETSRELGDLYWQACINGLLGNRPK